MKKLLLFLFTGIFSFANAQTVLYTDDLETTGSMIMQMGTNNSWAINSDYVGGTILGGFITIPDVPLQPGTFSSPNGNYLHPLADIATQEGVTNANFVLGGSSEQLIAAMTSTVNTTGYDNVTLKFWRTGGLDGVEVLYQVNGGGWVNSGYTLSGNPSNWIEETVTLPAGDDVNQFSIAFEFNEVTAQDPAPNHYHGIDEISIEGTQIGGGNPTLTAAVQNGTSFCGDDTITVDYNGTGTYNSGNNFILELSDDQGSFGSPTSIGTITSTASTGSIDGIVPTSITAGSLYRVRVNATDNAFTGSNNGTDLTLNPKPQALADATDTEVCEGDPIELIGNDLGNVTYNWSGPDNYTSGDQNPVINSSTLSNDGVYYLTTTVNGCTSDSAQVAITVNPTPAAPTITQNGNDLSSSYANGNQWYLDGAAINGATNQTHTATTAGVYTVQHTSSEGCTSPASEPIDLSNLSVFGHNMEQVVIAPNPFDNALHLENLEPGTSLIINDVTGKTVDEISVQTTHTTIETLRWKKGIYFMAIERQGTRQTVKLIKQ